MALIDTIELNDAQMILSELKDDPTAEIAKKYYDGDAWQAGDAWIGPRPAETDSDLTTVMEEIERGLVSKNTIAEVTHRHRDALIGTEPDWSVTVRRPLEEGQKPTAQEQSLIDEANAALTEWWDAREALTTLHEATVSLLLGRSGCLRLFVPQILVTPDARIPTFKDVAEAMGQLYFHSPQMFSARVYVDPDSQEKLGLYSFRCDRDPETEPVTDAARERSLEDRIEIQGLNQNKQTIIKIIGLTTEKQESQPLDLMGHLAMYEMKRPRFISQQVEQLTALVNMSFTMMGRNVVLGGFLERVLLNAQLPGRYVEDVTAPGGKRYQPDPFYVGAGSTNALSGLPIFSDPMRPTQVTGYTNPSVVYRDPVPVDTFKDSLAEAYTALLQEVGQSHVLIAKDATASGESRKQAAAEFVKTLASTKAQIESAGRWLLETSLAMAAQLSGQPGRFKDLRAVFQANVDLGPISAEEQNTAAMLWEKRVIDRTTAMIRVGVDDPDAEEAKLAAREEQDFKQQEQLIRAKQAENGNQGTGDGA